MISLQSSRRASERDWCCCVVLGVEDAAQRVAAPVQIIEAGAVDQADREGAVSRLSGHLRDHVHLRRGEGQFESSGLEFDARADPGVIRVRRYCRAVLPQLPGFHRTDAQRCLRPPRRSARRGGELKDGFALDDDPLE